MSPIPLSKLHSYHPVSSMSVKVILSFRTPPLKSAQWICEHPLNKHKYHIYSSFMGFLSEPVTLGTRITDLCPDCARCCKRQRNEEGRLSTRNSKDIAAERIYLSRTHEECGTKKSFEYVYASSVILTFRVSS